MSEVLGKDEKLVVGALYEVVDGEVRKIDEDCFESEVYLSEDLESHEIGQGILWDALNSAYDGDSFNPDLWMIVSRSSASSDREDFFDVSDYDAPDVYYVAPEDEYFVADSLLNAKSEGYYILVNVQYVNGLEKGEKFSALLHSITPIYSRS